MLPILEYFEKATHSYGWSLVLLTLLVRVMLWPLVASQTQSMQRMSQLQPTMKKMQEKYKNDPELMQKKFMEFYAKNRVNPMGGCLPMLLQIPIFFALFATFSGPPFGDKPIPVHVKVVAQQGAPIEIKKPTSNDAIPYVSRSGQLCKIAVYPGEVFLPVGAQEDFNTRAVNGVAPLDFKATWKIVRDNKPISSDEATIDENGHAIFKKEGDYQVQAVVAGVAKNEPFGFVSGLGKVANGVELLKPGNWDALFLIVAFGFTMWVAQKFTVKPARTPGQEMDEQQRIQQDTMKILPIVMTGTFFFIPLPVGVLIYIVLSNCVQSFQTWILMNKPVPPLVGVDDDFIDAQISESKPPKGQGPRDGNAGSDKKKEKGRSSSQRRDEMDEGERLRLEAAIEGGEKISLKTKEKSMSGGGGQPVSSSKGKSKKKKKK